MEGIDAPLSCPVNNTVDCYPHYNNTTALPSPQAERRLQSSHPPISLTLLHLTASLDALVSTPYFYLPFPLLTLVAHSVSSIAPTNPQPRPNARALPC